MHFGPFSVKKISDFSDFFSDFAAFSDFFDDLLNIGLLPPPPIKPPIPHGFSLSFSIKNKEKSEKIGFPMPTTKNGFQILNLHPKKHVFKKNTLFLMYFCLSFTKVNTSDIIYDIP